MYTQGRGRGRYLPTTLHYSGYLYRTSHVHGTITDLNGQHVGHVGPRYRIDVHNNDYALNANDDR